MQASTEAAYTYANDYGVFYGGMPRCRGLPCPRAVTNPEP